MITEKVAEMSTTILTGSSVKSPVARAKELIAQHPLIAFFALAYVFAWTIWFLVPQSTAIGVFGPPVAAVVISAILAPEKVKGSRARRWARFAVVFAVALAVWVLISPVLAPQAALQPWYWLWLPGAVAAALVAFILSGPLADRRGVRDLFGSLAPRRVGWSWYAAALLLGPAIWLLPIGLSLALGGQFPGWPNGAPPTLELVLVAFVWIALFGGGLEEPGWRGFALPRLQSRWSPLVASIILGFFWALWHAPEYFTAPGVRWGGPGALAGILFRFVWVIPLAIVFTWLYNRSGRSGLLTVILLHAAFNTSNYIVPLSPQAAVLFLGTTWAIALGVMVSGRMWRHLKQSDAPLVRAPASLSSATLSRKSNLVAVIESAVDIKRSPEQVFDYCSDHTREPEWNIRMKRVAKLSDGPMGVGTRYEMEFVPGHPMVVECVRFERPTAWDMVGESQGTKVGMSGQVLATEDGARLLLRTEIQPHGLLGLAVPLLRGRMQLELERDSAAIKAILEG